MKLRFHTKIYPREALDVATEAFEGLARVEVSVEGDYLVADVEAEEPGQAAEVVGEFQNYVLGETISIRGEP
jgi:hypothetical protein